MLHPKMADRYHEAVKSMIAALYCDSQAEAARGAVRALIDRIALSPNAAWTALTVDIHGDLAGILSVATNDQKRRVSKGYDLGVLNW